MEYKVEQTRNQEDKPAGNSEHYKLVICYENGRESITYILKITKKPIILDANMEIFLLFSIAFLFTTILN